MSEFLYYLQLGKAFLNAKSKQREKTDIWEHIKSNFYMSRMCGKTSEEHCETITWEEFATTTITNTGKCS